MEYKKIDCLVKKLLKDFGFALFAKKAKIIPKDEIQEFSKDISLQDEKEVLCWNLLNPDEKSELILHIGLVEESDKCYFRVASNEDVLYTKKVSIKDLQDKSAYLLGLA